MKTNSISNSKKSIYNLLFSYISQITIVVLGLIVPRITLMHYGSETNGLLNSVTQFIAYLVVFEAGIQAVALQSLYKPVHDDNRGEINEILAAVNINYRNTGFAYLVGLIILSFTYPLFAKTELGYFEVFLIVFFSGLGNVILFFVQAKYKILLQAEGKNYIIINTQTIITVCVNVAKIVLLSLGVNVVIVVISSFCLSLFQAIYISIYIHNKYSWIDLKVKPNYLAIKEKRYALIHQISGLICQNTDVLVLTIFCDLKVVSVYSLYKLIVSHLSSLLTIPFNSVSFALGQIFNTNLEMYKRVIDTIETYFSSFVFSIYTVLLMVFVPFIRLYTLGVSDINYPDFILAVLFILIELITFMRMAMLNTINYAGHFKNTLSQTIIESVINLTVSIVAVIQLGIYGVLIGTVVAFIYRTSVIILYTNKVILKRSSYKSVLIYVVNFSLLILVNSIYNLLHIQIDSYISFVIVGVIGVVICVPLFALLNHIIFNVSIKDINNVIKTI